MLLLTASPIGTAGQPGQDIESRAHARALANGVSIVVVERPGTAFFGGMLAFTRKHLTPENRTVVTLLAVPR